VIGLRASLASAIAWCDEHADPAQPRDSLRSRDLVPQLLSKDRAWAVGGVVARREALRSVAGVVGRLGAGGRLMVCFPDACLEDCTAEQVTNGFFDGQDVPPWDTWVAWLPEPSPPMDFGGMFLLAWVPAPFIDLAEKGMSVVLVQNICWLEDAPISNKAELLDLQPRWR